MKSISSLSGGQKSLVAIAFIFALQRVDPAPFYILDEADAHIDDHYKRSLVDMMRRQSEGAGGAQFILTAHKKEMIERADNLYRVKMVNNQSRVHKSDLREALDYFARKRRRETGSDIDADSPSPSSSRTSLAGASPSGDGYEVASPGRSSAMV